MKKLLGKCANLSNITEDIEDTLKRKAACVPAGIEEGKDIYEFQASACRDAAL